MHPDEASHGRITGFVHLTPVVAYLQRLDGRQSISMRKIPAWRIVQISCGKECRVRLGQVGTAAGVIAHSFFGQSLSDSQLSRATIIHAKQSEMPIRTFFSEVHAARAPTFEDSAETEQSHWLEERGTLPYGRQAPEDLRQAELARLEGSPRKGNNVRYGNRTT